MLVRCDHRVVSGRFMRPVGVPARSLKLQLRTTQCSAAKPDVYQGVYGPWTVDKEDVREVYGYRAGLTLAAAATAVGTVAALLPEENPLKETLVSSLDIPCFLGAAGLGVSLVLIHIYVTPMKRLLQALWLLGVAGATSIAITQDESVAEFVVNNPWAVWLVGPMFAALTGLAVKEGICYGKLEAALLAVITPMLLMGHLLQILPASVEEMLLVALTVTCWVFVTNKFQQPIKDDIGDKSIFMFRKLSEEQQQEALVRLQQIQQEQP